MLLPRELFTRCGNLFAPHTQLRKLSRYAYSVADIFDFADQYINRIVPRCGRTAAENRVTQAGQVIRTNLAIYL